MAKPIIIDQVNGITFFYLGKYFKFILKMDTVDYLKYVKDTTCWYMKRNNKSKAREIFYAAKCEYKTNKTIYLHWMMCKRLSPDDVIDHKNRDELDNRRLNLRSVSIAVNVSNSTLHNRKYGKSIRYKGFVIVKIKAGGKEKYQCYTPDRKYIAGGLDLEYVKIKIDNHLEEKTNV